MSERISNFTSSDLFSNLTSIEGKGVLYSCDEKKEHSKSRV
jgi:hypothetical protein